MFDWSIENVDSNIDLRSLNIPRTIYCERSERVERSEI